MRGDRIVQPQRPVVPQGEDRGGGEGLGHRGDAGDGIAGHRGRARGRLSAVELVVSGGTVGQHGALAGMTADDRPGHPGGLVLGDGVLEEFGDLGDGRVGKGGAVVISVVGHGLHCRTSAAAEGAVAEGAVPARENEAITAAVSGPSTSASCVGSMRAGSKAGPPAEGSAPPASQPGSAPTPEPGTGPGAAPSKGPPWGWTRSSSVRPRRVSRCTGCSSTASTSTQDRDAPRQ